MATILCFMPENCADFEVTLILDLLNGENGREIKTVGYTKEPVVSLSGIRHVADLTLEEAAELSDIEALIMPGGPIAPKNEKLASFMLKLHERGVLLAAICYAPQYLARCGLLDTHRYTTSCTLEDVEKLDITDPFPRANYTDERVVTDGNIITAKGYAFIDFAYAILRHLGLYDDNKKELDSYYNEMTNR